MRINSINVFSNKIYTPSFKHTAVPYPEYEQAYNKEYGNSVVSSLAAKLSSVFNPEVKQAADDIKTEINDLYSTNADKNGKKLSVVA